ncbi:hypothetical protein [uncultured Methylobacterium sp.]|jgi:hypothetical protein|uniref:hypothetical protein n=1 Tax=uncultured Methylobacterium sp. TaxID=157278 RepID=UPI00262E5831|nr:hypothetical protein [uncultured Methylobacterium sp.]
MLNAYYPDYMIEIARWAMHVHDPRGAAWLSRRLTAVGVPTGDRRALTPWPLPEVFGTLSRAPVLDEHDDIAEFRSYAMAAEVNDRWADDLEDRAERSTRMLRAASQAGESIIIEGLVTPAETGLVRDWLNSLAETDPRMLDKLPRVTWAQAVQHTLNYHRLLARRTLRIAGDDGTVDPIYTTDGHRWLHLVTRDALDRESAAMGSCVGDGGYDHLTWQEDQAGKPVRPSDNVDALLDLWSLRDPEGRSVLTAEIGMGCIEQVKRQFNYSPVPANVPHLAVLLAHLSTLMPHLGLPAWLVTDARDGSLHHLHQMPDGIHLADGQYLDPNGWTRIPAGLRIEGGTILAYHGAEPVAFQRLHVIGKLAIHGTVRLDAGLVVEGDLDLSSADDKAAPEGARVTGQVITERVQAGGYEAFMRHADIQNCSET